MIRKGFIKYLKVKMKVKKQNMMKGKENLTGDISSIIRLYTIPLAQYLSRPSLNSNNITG